MPNERVERRLTAILAADVAGYSRLMGADEEGTLAVLKAIRRNLGDPTIAAHRGRITAQLIDAISGTRPVDCALRIEGLRLAAGETGPS
jgi:adenylate cyclase